jgi:hypothetical protein
VLKPTRDQCTKLAAVASFAKTGHAAIEAEAKAKLDKERERLLSAREKLLAGGVTPQATDALLSGTSGAIETMRVQKSEALVVAVRDRVRTILTQEQALRVESDLAPTADQPWRRYSRILTGPNVPARPGGRMPADPGKWLKELRDLRIDSAEGDPAYEVQDFGKKLTRGIPANTPLYEQSVTQARAFATQVLAMPPREFNQREWELARMAARQELDTRNQQHLLEGKPLETFDPYRWLAVEVMLSPRAAINFKDLAAQVKR